MRKIIPLILAISLLSSCDALLQMAETSQQMMEPSQSEINQG